MAVDFDFDTDYNDDDADDDSGEELDPEEEFDDEEYEDESEEDEGGEKRSPLRIILLVLVILVLLCVVCWLASSFMSLPIPGFGSSEEAAPSAPVTQDTPVPPAPDEEQAGEGEQVDESVSETGDAAAPEGGDTEEATDSAEAPVSADGSGDAAGEADGTESGDATAGGEGGDASTQPTDEPTDEPTSEPTDEPTVVAGPTATPGGDAAAECDTNMPPSASTGGPYVVTKGLTIVTLDGSGSTDPDGNIVSHEWDFGDGESGEGETAIHEYKTVGSYQVSLKVTDNCGEVHIATTNVVISAEGDTTGAGGDAGTSEDQAASCDDNTPPVADAGGPYDGMMGKGQAIVTLDGSASSDADGTIESYEWDFGDGESGEGETAVHRYSETGSYQATLTVTDNCGDTNEATANVTISGPTPPAETETPEATPPATPVATATPNGNGGWMPPPVDPALGTVGFCYKVQPGNTLSGIAAKYGVTVPQLAYVNGVSPNYYVKAGEGFFIPTGPIAPQGPNIYQARPGDTLSSVAYQCGVPANELAWINGISENAALAPGQIVKIPPPWSY